MNIYSITLKHELTGKEVVVQHAAKTERTAKNGMVKELPHYWLGYYITNVQYVRPVNEHGL